jgi:hypothetical protein
MTEQEKPHRPMFVRSFGTQQLVQRLTGAEIGETIEYDELSQIAGEDVQVRGRGMLQSAVRILQAEFRRVFVSVRGVGVQRADNTGIVQTGTQRLQHIHRTAKRAMNTLGCVDPAKLDPAAQQEFNTKASHLGMLVHCSSPKATKRIAASVEQTQQKLPLDKTLDAFRGNGGTT